MAAGVNPVDTYIRSGNYAGLPSLPYTPGKDCSGIVEEVGDGVNKFKKGDKVYTTSSVSGTYAELSICNEEFTYKLPEGLTFEQGAW